MALDEGITVVAHSFADPTPFVGPAHDHGALVLFLRDRPADLLG